MFYDHFSARSLLAKLGRIVDLEIANKYLSIYNDLHLKSQ